MPFVIFIFSFVFYRVMFKAGFDENISLVADFLVSASAGIAAAFITAGVSKAVYKAMIRETPRSGRDKILLDSFLNFVIVVAVFVGVSFFIIYGFSDRLFEEFDYDDGYFWAAIFLAVAPTAHYLVTIVHSKNTFSKVLDAEHFHDLD